MNISIDSVNRWFKSYRTAILGHLRNAPRFSGEVEIDSSFFGRSRNDRAKYLKKLKLDDETIKKALEADHRRPRGGHIRVFAIIQRSDRKVYLEIVPDNSAETLMPIIKKIVKRGSTVYSDGWRAFSKLKDKGYNHVVINHSISYSDGKGGHTNNVEGFWSFAKHRLRKFNGISRRTAIEHLKECEFRYNNRKDMASVLKLILSPKSSRRGKRAKKLK